MALAGGGAICIWNDIAPEGRAEFYAWHNSEHIPERVGIPGFLRGRRYIALDRRTAPEFFTLYETETVEILTGAPYLARLNAPTPWTRAATQAFRNTSRALARRAASNGRGDGGMLATLRFAVGEAQADAAPEMIARDLLPAAVAVPECVAAHLCLTNRSASAERTAESRERTDILAAPEWVVLIEGCSPDAVGVAADEAAARLAAICDGAPVTGLYRLEFDLRTGA